jgi:prepilin-type N-terminal cleavage/methylation domain-containing protein
MKTSNRSDHEQAPGFTLIELLVTISVIMILAGLTVGAVSRASRSAREARVRAELNQMVLAIESYKEAMGMYPPDNPADPARNPLFYELTGVWVDTERGEFRTREGGEVIPADLLMSEFGAEGLGNAVADAARARRFLEPKATQHADLLRVPPAGNLRVLVVPVSWPLNALVHPVPENPGLNPWRYLASPHATNNSSSFDLWAEYVDGRNVKVLGNWSTAPAIDRAFVKR